MYGVMKEYYGSYLDVELWKIRVIDERNQYEQRKKMFFEFLKAIAKVYELNKSD